MVEHILCAVERPTEVADTSGFGVLRLIADKPEIAQEALREELRPQAEFAIRSRAAIDEIVRRSMSVAMTEKYILELLEGQQKNPRRVNVGTFLNNLNQSLAKIQLSGISAISPRSLISR